MKFDENGNLKIGNQTISNIPSTLQNQLKYPWRATLNDDGLFYIADSDGKQLWSM